MTPMHWTPMFVAAGVFNWLTGLSLMFDVGPIAATIGVTLARYDPLYSPFVGWLVIVFGTLYLLIARAAENQRAAVVAGALAKIGMFALVWLAVLRGEAPVTMGYLVFAHLMFAIAFAIFLMRSRSSPSA